MTGSARQARSVARLAAVQALYQMETAGAGAETVIREFSDHRFDRDLEGARLAHADEAFFGALVRGVVAEQDAVDAAVAPPAGQRAGGSSGSTPPPARSCAPAPSS